MRELWKPDERGASVEIGQAGFPAPFVSGLHPPIFNNFRPALPVPDSHRDL